MSLSSSINAAIASSIPGAMEELGEHLVDHIKETLSGHSPSEPGDPPGLDTGNLRAGISYSVNGTELTITSSAHYSDYLEYGTSKMSARPFLAPAMSYAEQIIPEIFQEALIDG